MAAKFRFTGLRQFVEECSHVAAEKAAERVVKDLKTLGPYRTGFFESQWVVLPGDKNVRATEENPLSQTDRRSSELPLPRTITEVDIPPLDESLSPAYTIANRSKYRNIAMDLVPGRLKDGSQGTAPQDWYANYMQGGGLRKALGQSVSDAAQDPRVRGFRSNS